MAAESRGMSEYDMRSAFNLFDRKGEGKLKIDFLETLVRACGLTPSAVTFYLTKKEKLWFFALIKKNFFFFLVRNKSHSWSEKYILIMITNEEAISHKRICNNKMAPTPLWV